MIKRVKWSRVCSDSDSVLVLKGATLQRVQKIRRCKVRKVVPRMQLSRDEPRREKTCRLGFRPGPTPTGLYSP